MPKITVLPHPDVCPEGAVINDAPEGTSICRILLDNHIEIEHACELSCACTTCHVVIKEASTQWKKPVMTRKTCSIRPGG